jgi:hypothetical protein
MIKQGERIPPSKQDRPILTARPISRGTGEASSGQTETSAVLDCRCECRSGDGESKGNGDELHSGVWVMRLRSLEFDS